MSSSDKLTTATIKEALGREFKDEDVVALKRFIEKAGDIETAKATLDMLTELQDAA